MDNAENEEQANNVPEHTLDTEMPNASVEDETVDQNNQPNHTPKPAEGNGTTDNVRKAPDSIASVPGSWQIPPGALAASNNPITPVNPASYQAPTASSKAAEKIEKVEQRIRDDQYDLDAWTILINEVQNTGEIDAIREVYERVLKVFPTSVGSFFLIHSRFYFLFSMFYFTLDIKDGEKNGIAWCEVLVFYTVSTSQCWCPL
jgi:hypothetical protein